MADRLYTSGDIARALKAKVTRVRHILATREHVRPVGRAGLVRLYRESAIQAVSDELGIQEDRSAQRTRVVGAKEHPAGGPGGK